jgi:hypothetical protein
MDPLVGELMASLGEWTPWFVGELMASLGEWTPWSVN